MRKNNARDPKILENLSRVPYIRRIKIIYKIVPEKMLSMEFFFHRCKETVSKRERISGMPKGFDVRFASFRQ